MVRLVVLIAMSLIASVAMAEDVHPLLRPNATRRLTLANLLPITHVATFKGSVWVQGTLVIDWSGEPDAEPDDRLVARIDLDNSPTNRLPYFEGYEVSSVYLDANEVLDIAFSPDLAAKLRQKTVTHAELDGRFHISKYRVTVACDNADADAHLVELKTSHTPRVSNYNQVPGCT